MGINGYTAVLKIMPKISAVCRICNRPRDSPNQYQCLLSIFFTGITKKLGPVII